MHIIHPTAKHLIGIHVSKIPEAKQIGLQRDGSNRTTSVAYRTPDGFVVAAELAPNDDIYEAAPADSPEASTILNSHQS